MRLKRAGAGKAKRVDLLLNLVSTHSDHFNGLTITLTPICEPRQQLGGTWRDESVNRNFLD